MKTFVLILMVAVAAGWPSAAHATAITITATGVNAGSGTQLKASATFNFDTLSQRVIVTLSNTSTADVVAPGDVLTAVFFNISNGVTLNSGCASNCSATLATGSTVLFGPAPTGGVVGGEWAYGSGLVGAPRTATQGISSAGFGLFGNATFPGANLSGPIAVDGIQYGLTSAGDNAATGNTAVTGDFPLIKSSVVFKLSGAPSTFNPATSIFNVSFQYGTSFLDTNTFYVPEPSTFVLLSSGLLLAARRRRRR